MVLSVRCVNRRLSSLLKLYNTFNITYLTKYNIYLLIFSIHLVLVGKFPTRDRNSHGPNLSDADDLDHQLKVGALWRL